MQSIITVASTTTHPISQSFAVIKGTTTNEHQQQQNAVPLKWMENLVFMAIEGFGFISFA